MIGIGLVCRKRRPRRVFLPKDKSREENTKNGQGLPFTKINTTQKRLPANRLKTVENDS